MLSKEGLREGRPRIPSLRGAIMKTYLSPWFKIFGRSRPNQDLLYIDGFAGPGHYVNSSRVFLWPHSLLRERR